MANQFRIECPTCLTSYTQERCGVRTLEEGEGAAISIKCLVCARDFELTVTPKLVVVQPGWFQRIVLRKTPVEAQVGHTIATKER